MRLRIAFYCFYHYEDPEKTLNKPLLYTSLKWNLALFSYIFIIIFIIYDNTFFTNDKIYSHTWIPFHSFLSSPCLPKNYSQHGSQTVCRTVFKYHSASALSQSAKKECQP